MQLSGFSLSNLSIKQRLPLLIGTLLFGIVLASTVAAYRGVKESALEVGGDRLQTLTKQLANLLQQSTALLLTKTFTEANNPAIRAFLQSPSAATRSGASLILEQFAAPQDPNGLQVELWDTNHSLVLTVPNGAAPEPVDLENEFKASSVDPFKTSGPMVEVKDTIAVPAVVAVKDDLGKPIGYLVRWRRVYLNPPPKQLTELLGSEAQLYFGNNRGDLLTNLERIVPKPQADLGSTLDVMHYSRDGNRVMALGRPISGTPWFVAVEFPEQPYLTQANRFLRRIVLIDLVLFIVGIAGAFTLSSGITRPLHSLTAAVSAISGGDYSKTVDIPQKDELGSLAAGFNAMTIKVRASQSALEENVQALRESEQRLQTVIENLSEGLVVSDLSGQLLNWNRAALEIHGFSSLDECLLKLPEFTSIFELSDLDGSVLDIEQWPLPRIIRGESVRNLEVRIRRLDSDWSRVFNYGGALVRETNGRVTAIVTMSDITDRKRAEEALKEQSRILDLAPVLIRDIGGRIIFWNSGAEQMYGWSSEEAMGQTTHSLLKIEFPRPLEEIKARLFADGHWEGELVHTKRSGERIVVASHWVLHKNDHDEPKAILEVNNDITERREAEKEIRRLNEELEERVADRTAQLQAANKELEAFSYSVSHDLRAPLRHINGFSQALLEDYADKLDETGKGYLQEVRGASQEMAQLIDDVLQLARVTRTEMHREPVNMSEIAQNIIDDLRKGQDHSAVVNIEEGLTTMGDKRLMQIVLGNLLGNAWKFTSRQKQAEIVFGQSKQNGDSFYFVRDNGAGFDMSYVGKLFGAFQRLHTAAEFEGTGIGLATVQRIVNRHGGRVWAEGKLNEGATFYFTLSPSREMENGEQSDTSGRR